MFYITMLMISLSMVSGAPRGAPRNDEMKYVIKRLLGKELLTPKSETNPMVPAGQPGDGPYRMQAGFSKRDEEYANSPKSCEDSEWFVLVNDMPACVDPLWRIGYDPTFCTKMKNGWIYCGCDDDQTPGMSEGIDTCIDSEKAKREGRCSLTPCPPDFDCIEKTKGVRFDCVKGDVVVPSYYDQGE